MSAVQLATNVGNQDYGTILSTELAFSGGWQIQLDNTPGSQGYDSFAAAYWVGSMSSGDGSTSSGSYVKDNCHCVVAGQWIHLVAVFDDDAKRFTLYDNGTAVARTDMPGAIQQGDSTLYIGKWSQLARALAADLDDFAIWSRALTAGEVAILSQQPPPD